MLNKQWLTKLLFVGALTQAAELKYDDFSEIPMRDSVESANKDATPIVIPLYTDKTYVDHIKDHLYKLHAKVQSSPSGDVNEDINAPAKAKMHGVKDFKIENDRSMNYYTKLYVGSAQNEVRVAFDTQATLSLINSSNCQGCTRRNGGFEYQRSYTIRKINDAQSTVKINDEEAKGVLAHDDVKLEKDGSQTVREFPFLLVNYWTQSIFENIDGVIGLAKSYYSLDGNDSGSAFMSSLFQQGIINKKIFAIHFDGFGGSQIMLGGYDSSKMVPNVPMVYLDAPYEKQWKVTINAFRVGNKPTFKNGAKSAFYFPEKDAFLDSFNPYIKIPHSIGTQVFSAFFHDQPDIRSDDDGLLYGPCDINLYQDISLFVNDRYYVKLVPESYVIDIGKKDQCFLPFQYNEDDSWILGEPFFRNFYTVFDDTRGLIGLTPSINFVHSSITEGIVPNDELNYPGRIRKAKPADQRAEVETLPSLGDPLSIARYLQHKGTDVVKNGVSTTTIAEIVGVVVMLGVGCCCGLAVMIFAGVQGVKYLTQPAPQQNPYDAVDPAGEFPHESMQDLMDDDANHGQSVPPADGIPGVQQASGPRFKKSRRANTSNRDIPMSNLLSSKQIEDRIAAIKATQQPRQAIDSDEEIFANSTTIGQSNMLF